MKSPYLDAFLTELRHQGLGLRGLRHLMYFRSWRHSLVAGGSPLLDRVPWITFAAARYLAKHLQPGMRVFEYGSGGSTLFLLSLGVGVTSVEHDASWFDAVRSRVHDAGYSHWTGLMIPPEEGDLAAPVDSANPSHYASRDVSHVHFRRYASAIDAYPDAHFDLVVVDGRARPACLCHAVGKVRPGGLLVLDNAERSYYLSPTVQQVLHPFGIVLDEMGPTPYSWQFTRTNIWVRNSS